MAHVFIIIAGKIVYFMKKGLDIMHFYENMLFKTKMGPTNESNSGLNSPKP